MGPFDDISRGQLNVDEAIASGIAATQPVATTTTGEAPVIPQTEEPTGGLQSNLQVESPQWAGLPSQQDFGQVDVRRGNYNTGMVPTVNVQMPFAALANRQQALAQRKAAIDKQVTDFDLYSKVGSPDARYAQAFNRYATQGMDQWLNDYAESMHGGDRRAAMRDIATNPEAGRMWMNKSKEFQAVAEENKKWMEVAEKRLAQHVSGEATIRDPKALAALSNFVASVDESRTPIGADGKPLDAGSFGTIARQAVPEIQKLQYIEKVIDPMAQSALKTTFGVTSLDEVPRVGGNIVMTTQQKKTYDDYLNMIVSGGDDRFVEDFYGGNKEDALKDLQAVYPTSVEDKTEFKGVDYAPVGRDGSGNDIPAGALTVDYAPLPQESFAMYDDKGKVVEGKSALGQGAKEMEFAYLPIFDVVSGQGRTAQPRMFNTMAKGGGGKNIYVIPERIVDINGKKFIFGKEAGETGTSKEGDRWRSQRDDIQDFKKLKSVVVPYEGNEGRLKAYFPWLTQEAVEEKLGGTKPRGGNPQQSKAAAKPASDPLGIL
jgi:hypothetical protein